MSYIDCESCSELRENAPDFVNNGVTSEICTSLKADTGLNPNLSPLHNDGEDLHTANDCLIGRMDAEIEKYDVCDWKEYMHQFIPNLYELLKAIICAIQGIWTNIHRLWNKLNALIEALGGGENTIPVFRTYRRTVPKSEFVPYWRVTSGTQQNKAISPGEENEWYNVADVTEWFAGAGNNVEVGELWIKVLVADMDNIVGVFTQSWVVPGGNPYDGKGKRYIQTVNVQEWYREGDYLLVNYDVYELCPEGGGTAAYNGGPYPVTIDFLIVGSRTI